MANNRYSSLNRRPAATSTLFQDYPGSRPSSSSSRPVSGAPVDRSSSPYLNNGTNSYSFSNNHSNSNTPPTNFRPATPNKRGQYSAAVLEELESQNETTATTMLSQKVSQLKSLTVAIGEEIRDSSDLASKLNDQFEGTGVKLKGTMRRMMRMADRTGVGWRVWLGFFVAVWLLFAWIWLF